LVVGRFTDPARPAPLDVHFVRRTSGVNSKN
jgi:hypothetical protein